MFLSVAVPVRGLDPLTYRAPGEGPVPPRGARVLVSVGQRQLTGCVLATDVAAPDGIQVRELDGVLDTEPFLPGFVIDLALWIAEYYAAGIGEVVAAALPPMASLASERRIIITERGRERLAGMSGERGAAARVLRALATGASFTVRELASRAGEPASVEQAVRMLVRDGAVVLERALRGRASGFRVARVAALTAQGQEVVETIEAAGSSATFLGLGDRQREALAALRGAPDGLDLRTLTQQGIAGTTVRRLASRGLVAMRTERRERDPFHSDGDSAAIAHASRLDRVLTSEQDAALRKLLPRLDPPAFHVALLHGVTGSGKTELYLRLAAETVRQQRRVLMLVPEIALTPAIAGAFRAAFGSRVAIQHSGLSDGERHDQWHRIREGGVDVVVGTRSAVLAPLDRTGLVIVDEEHDSSYKQEESPRYNGRDVAIVRARQQNALVVLGSATPSLESYRNAVEGRYELVVLERRVLDRPLAAVRIVNMRDELAEQGPDVVLSAALAEALQARVAEGEQAMLLLNRRGYATAVFCRQCGATLDCPNCSVSLTVHHERSGARARCHYCNHSAAVPKACSACAAPYVEQVGVGTARVEADVAKLLPGARIARVDRDVVQRRGAMQSILRRIAAHELDVVVGTQMIAKGHDFPRVTLVGVISADVGLGLPDFRAAERTFQLLTQVAGRAGRGDRPGEAIIQTLFPEHYSIQLACQQDYKAFFEKEYAFRRAMRYPPAVGLINVVVRGASLGEAMTRASDLASALRAHPDRERMRVLGPAPAPLGKVRGAYRAQILVKGASRSAMRRALMETLAAHPAIQRRAIVDVDPLSVM
ncbi:MAG TPA: primosomal protein N' [Vicinamibacterales bacterium]|nr:primosomal protein N' [Vicinamibacterales bacterium]